MAAMRPRPPGLKEPAAATTTHGVRARHDQLTNAALAAWFGALRSRDLETKSL